MKTKTYFAVFTYTESGLDYMVKGNFGSNHSLAQEWSDNHALEYPNGLFVKKILI